MGKRGVCYCGLGGFRVHGHRWRRLSHCETTGVFQLKCLECGRKWNTRRNYGFALDGHRERTRAGMTDQQILDRINDGTLIVCMLGRAVWSDSTVGGFGPRRKTSLRIWERTKERGGTYRFTQICQAGQKKKISIHRLVWIAAHRQLVPEGFDVDHRKGRDVEDPDGIHNLRLLESGENRSIGAKGRWEKHRASSEDPF